LTERTESPQETTPIDLPHLFVLLTLLEERLESTTGRARKILPLLDPQYLEYQDDLRALLRLVPRLSRLKDQVRIALRVEQ
jgi:hypothetical protein